MAPLDNPAIPKGSTVVITGVNGLLGQNTADQFLHYGYKVRGTVRDVEKNAHFTKYFNDKYGQGSFELVQVPDMAAEGAYDEVAKDASAFIHMASNLSFSPDPNVVIPSCINGAVNALKTTYASPTIKRFVFTSSSSAALTSYKLLPPITVTESTWNEATVKLAWAEPPYEPQRGGAVYAASKTQSEQAVWKFHHENQYKRPDLHINTILPNLNLGKSLDRDLFGYPSSASTAVSLWNSQPNPLVSILDPQWFINVQDAARLHVAAAVLPDVQNERIFGMAEKFSWGGVVDIMRKHAPERKLPENISSGEDNNVIKPRDRAEKLLRDLGRPGWVSLEETILGVVEDEIAAEKASA